MWGTRLVKLSPLDMSNVQHNLLGKSFILLGLGAKSKSRWHFSPGRTWDPVLELSSPALRVHRCKDEGISNRIKVIVVIKLLAAVLVFVWDFSPASPSHCLWEPFNWSEVILIANPIVCFLSRTNFYINFQFNWASWTLTFLCFSRLFVLSRREKHQKWHFTIFTNTPCVCFSSSSSLKKSDFSSSWSLLCQCVPNIFLLNCFNPHNQTIRVEQVVFFSPH